MSQTRRQAKHQEVVTVQLHRAAPAKPPLGAPCNGCGVCCALTPCPLGWLLFRRRGACPALHWQEEAAAYRCGLVVAPGLVLPWLPRWLAPAFARWARRRIAAGAGCDFDGEELPAD